ncbi:hypothetical protein GGR57DRAFT_460301 [Xylariaceae sp. FL1272]|nr:hypothetical protein GGR57DRAFT_460301 [Xylariaceae sp. FL1272]
MRSLSLAGATARAAVSRACKTSAVQTPTRQRAFSSLPHLRPSIVSSNNTVFRPCNSTNTLSSRIPTTTSSSPGVTDGVIDIIPKSSITAHPALAGPLQVRCGPRANLSRSSRLKRKRRHGFLSRIRTRLGRQILQRRRAKGRLELHG